MARPTSGEVRSKAVATSVVLGLAVALVPRAWLTIITDVAWEQSIISVTAFSGAGLAAGLPWAYDEGGRVARRSHIWVSVFVVTATTYAISVSPVFLLAAFCTAFVGMLDLWMARAHLASMAVRSRLEDSGR